MLDLHGFSAGMAECAVRFVLRHELGNYIQQDLKVVTGRGKHSVGDPVLIDRRVDHTSAGSERGGGVVFLVSRSGSCLW